MREGGETRMVGPESSRRVLVRTGSRIHVPDGRTAKSGRSVPRHRRPWAAGVDRARTDRFDLVRGLLRDRTGWALRGAVPDHGRPAGGGGAEAGGLPQGVGAVGL